MKCWPFWVYDYAFVFGKGLAKDVEDMGGWAGNIKGDPFMLLYFPTFFHFWAITCFLGWWGRFGGSAIFPCQVVAVVATALVVVYRYTTFNSKAKRIKKLPKAHTSTVTPVSKLLLLAAYVVLSIFVCSVIVGQFQQLMEKQEVGTMF